DRRQRVEARGLPAEVPRLLDVALALVGLAEAVEGLGVLLVGLEELGDRLVVVLLGERDLSGARGGGPDPRRVLLRLGALAEDLRLALRRREILLRRRHAGKVVVAVQLGVVLDPLREARRLDELQTLLEFRLGLVGLAYLEKDVSLEPAVAGHRR